MQHFAGLGFERVAAQMLVFLLDLAETREDPVHLVGLRRVGHRMIELFELVMQVAHAAAAENRLVEHGAAGHLFDVLAEVADRHPLRHRDVALVRRFLADDHAEQRGLAGAVRPDEADLLAGIELEGRVDEQDLFAVLLADLGEGDHGPCIVIMSGENADRAR